MSEHVKKVDLFNACVEVEYLGRPRMMISAARISELPSIDIPDEIYEKLKKQAEYGSK